MEKTKLISLIQAAKVSDELKAKLSSMVGEQEEVSPETLDKIKAELDSSAEAAIQDIVNMQVLDAKEKFDGEMTQVDSQVGQFTRELSDKADAADMESARNVISQQ